MIDNAMIVTAYVTDDEREKFLLEWGISSSNQPWLLMQRDLHGEGCGATKNKGVRRATASGADVIVVLDGDCYPSADAPTLEVLTEKHVQALRPQPVELFQSMTMPRSRGTPYCNKNRYVMLPVAASMGFWEGVPDYCAARQLAFDLAPMSFAREVVFCRYFPLCGMNIAFRACDWLPWCQFIEVPRFDDIWMGWLWQREAYRRGCCFNLNGPLVRHARQSNAWKNLIAEAAHLEANETLWREIMRHPSGEYGDLLRLLPAGAGNLDVHGARETCGR